MERKVIILAAGKGVRMNVAIPKVLTPVNGKPMIEYALSAVEKICKPVVIVGYKGADVEQFIGNRADFVWQVEQLGTGHAVACAR